MNKKDKAWKDFLKHPLVKRGFVVVFLYLLMLTRVFGLLDLDPAFLLDLRWKIGTKVFFDAIANQVAYGRDAYLVFHLIDYMFIIFFYPFLRLIAKRLFLRPFIPALVLIAGVADLLENVFIDISLLLFPTQVTGFAVIVSVLTPLKIFCLGCFLIASIVRLLQMKRHKDIS